MLSDICHYFLTFYIFLVKFFFFFVIIFYSNSFVIFCFSDVTFKILLFNETKFPFNVITANHKYYMNGYWNVLNLIQLPKSDHMTKHQNYFYNFFWVGQWTFQYPFIISIVPNIHLWSIIITVIQKHFLISYYCCLCFRHHGKQ